MNAKEVAEKLKGKFKEDILKIEEKVKDKLYININKKKVKDIADYVFNELKARFNISAGTDRRNIHGDFQITHIFSLDSDKIFLLLQTSVDPNDPNIDSITPKVPGANWAEREFRDMIGVNPIGHPDPRRLVLSDDWPENVYPLRKDFPADCKIPGVSIGAPGPRVVMKEPPPDATVVPIGPFFPVLEEPSQWRVFVKGETVVGCDYRGFYIHRGIEKMGDSVLTYNQIPFIAERICGICGFVHSCCYCQTVEEAGGIEIPKRAKYIRSIILELERIHSHLLWLGIAGHIIGFDTVLMQSWRMREPVMWLTERITGNRKTYGMNLIGGVRRDITKENGKEILEVIGKIEKELLALIDAIQGDTTLMMRLKDVGILSYEDAVKMSVTGPTARGSGVEIDARVDHPFAAYEYVPVKKCVHKEGDVLARTLVRLEETLESIRIIRECLKQMPDGDIMANLEGDVTAGKEGVSVVEAPRGEVIHYVITGPENKPYRWRVRAPTYANLQSVPLMFSNATLADVPITLGSIDPCFSCTERVEVVDLKKGKSKIYTQDELLKLSRRKYGGK
jgi:Ni,Fe-hydrogenase III large subunit/Ni,Fe-hydrogenase III component G